MGVRATSRKAYFTEVHPKLGDKQQKVLVALQMSRRPVNNQEIAEHLGWPINSVTPRVQELRELGKVEEAFRDIYPKTNRRVIYWRPIRKEKVANDCVG